MYAGLTISDKPALLDVKARGAEWIARDKNGMICGYASKPTKRTEDGEWYTDDGFELEKANKLRFVKWTNPAPVNIDLALAQIAEMESKENNALSEKASEKGCMTWNERINQMTVEEKVEWLNCTEFCRVTDIPIEECNSYKDCKECMRAFLNSPYTEGEKEDTADEG